MMERKNFGGRKEGASASKIIHGLKMKLIKVSFVESLSQGLVTLLKDAAEGALATATYLKSRSEFLALSGRNNPATNAMVTAWKSRNAFRLMEGKSIHMR